LYHLGERVGASFEYTSHRQAFSPATWKLPTKRLNTGVAAFEASMIFITLREQ
jgi:hypothetical protein